MKRYYYDKPTMPCMEQNRYEIVDKIPKGYEVWHIGENMGSDTLVPLCQVIPATFQIIRSSLKAIEMTAEEKKIVEKATMWGIKARTPLAAQGRAILKKYSE